MLTVAEQFEKNKMADRAAEKYADIVKRYPGTAAAKQAEERLRVLQSGK